MGGGNWYPKKSCSNGYSEGYYVCVDEFYEYHETINEKTDEYSYNETSDKECSKMLYDDFVGNVCSSLEAKFPSLERVENEYYDDSKIVLSNEQVMVVFGDNNSSAAVYVVSKEIEKWQPLANRNADIIKEYLKNVLGDVCCRENIYTRAGAWISSRVFN